jgi:hypothetical protein
VVHLESILRQTAVHVVSRAVDKVFKAVDKFNIHKMKNVPKSTIVTMIPRIISFLRFKSSIIGSSSPPIIAGHLGVNTVSLKMVI